MHHPPKQKYLLEKVKACLSELILFHSVSIVYFCSCDKLAHYFSGDSGISNLKTGHAQVESYSSFTSSLNSQGAQQYSVKQNRNMKVMG